MTRSTVFLALFVSMALMLPTFFFLIADAAFMPLGGILLCGLRYLFEAPGLAVLALVHVALYAAVLTGIARVLTNHVCPKEGGEIRRSFFKGCMAVIFVIGMLPLNVGGHGTYGSVNSYLFYPVMIDMLWPVVGPG